MHATSVIASLVARTAARAIAARVIARRTIDERAAKRTMATESREAALRITAARTAARVRFRRVGSGNRMRATLCLALAGIALVGTPAQAAWRERNLGVPSRKGVTMPFVFATAEGVETKAIVVWINGGIGGTTTAREGVLSEEKDGFSMRGQLAERIGAVAVLGIPSDAASVGITLDARETPEHVQDIAAVIDALRPAYPNAKFVLAGISNGARSAAHAGAVLSKSPGKIAGVILLSSSPEAWREEWISEIKVPLLAIQHKRDSCLPYRDIEGKAKWHDFVTVEDMHKPRPINGVHDCGPESAHGFTGKERQVNQAIAEWITTGKTAGEIQ